MNEPVEKARVEWNKLVDHAMAADFSWESSARKYENLYRQLLGE